MLNRTGTLVGQDELGNRYFENRAYQVGAQQDLLALRLSSRALPPAFQPPGRHRWVQYADQKDYNASCIPREWCAFFPPLALFFLTPPRRSLAGTDGYTTSTTARCVALL